MYEYSKTNNLEILVLIYYILLRQPSLRHTAHLTDILSYSDDTAHLNILIQQLCNDIYYKNCNKEYSRN